MLEPLKNQPLSPDQFSPMALKAVGTDTPLPLKMMAAKGALPLPPEELLFVWYQLSFDPDENIKKTVIETVKGFDSAILSDLASKDQPESVLDWLAQTTEDNDVLEKIIINNKTHDATLMALAATTTKDLVDLIAANQVRILRAPDIIAKIYLNPAARMATVDRLISFAKEHHLEVTGMPGVQEVISAEISDDEPGISDEAFEALLAEAVKDGFADLDDDIALPQTEQTEQTEHAEQKEENTRKLSRSQLIEKMNAPQRIRLALVGSRSDRSILLRDTRRVVYMSVVRSPKITLSEVEQICTSKSVPDDMIAYCAKRRDWIRYYPVMVALVNNPKCPLPDAVTFLRQLRPNDLKALTRSKSVPAQLVRQAQAICKQKGSR